jgi:hypothetical protein
MQSTIEAIRVQLAQHGKPTLSWVEQSIDIIRALEHVSNSIQLTYCYKIQGYTYYEIAKRAHISRRSVINSIHALRSSLQSIAETAYT